MGVFQQWQPIYAAHNVPTFPVRGDTKRPAVKGYLKVGPQVSERFADKFGGYDAFGFALKRAGITVLDVDTPDERVLADALDRHGQTPLVIRTGSGNWQAYYRNRGEGRRIRPWSGKPIDVLGDGFTIAPPSKGALGWYAFVQGTLDDLDRLPSIKGLAVPGEAPAATPNKPERIAIAKGQRNRELLRFCMTEARSCASLDELVDRAAAFAETALSPVPEPVTAEEIKRTAMSAWGYEERGENWCGKGRVVAFDHDTLDRYLHDPDALLLLTWLKRHHWGREFVIANGMAVALGWGLPRFCKARQRLLDDGIIRCINPGGRGPADTPVYAWGPGRPAAQGGDERRDRRGC